MHKQSFNALIRLCLDNFSALSYLVSSFSGNSLLILYIIALLSPSLSLSLKKNKQNTSQSPLSTFGCLLRLFRHLIDSSFFLSFLGLHCRPSSSSSSSSCVLAAKACSSSSRRKKKASLNPYHDHYTCMDARLVISKHCHMLVPFFLVKPSCS